MEMNCELHLKYINNVNTRGLNYNLIIMTVPIDSLIYL